MPATRPATPLERAEPTSQDAGQVPTAGDEGQHNGRGGLEEALHQALRLTETGEGAEALQRAEGDAGTGLKLAIPPRVPPNAPAHPPRPALHSMQSSFATTYSSRSPASRTTSNTSIISVHESLPSTVSNAPKSAPQSPNMAPYHPGYGPSSPNTRRIPLNAGWGPGSRSPSVSSDSAYPHLLPFHPYTRPGLYQPHYPVGAVPYAMPSAPPRSSSSSALYGHARPQAASPVSFIHPFAAPHSVHGRQASPPYVQGSGWQPAGPPPSQAVHPAYNHSREGSVVYDESGALVPSSPYAYSQPYAAPPVYYPAPPGVAAYPYMAVPPSLPDYPHPGLSVPQAFPPGYSPPEVSSQSSGAAFSSPYSPTPGLVAEQDGLHYPISSARSSVSSHPSSLASWPMAGPHGAAHFAAPPPPPPNLPHTRGSMSAGMPVAFATPSLHPHSAFAPMPTVGESRDSSGGTQTSRGSAINPHVATAGISPTAMSASEISPSRSSIPFDSSPGELGVRPVIKRRDLPRPPTHSPHALWVGNVPSDASHAELWQFFQTRPTPRMCGVVPSPNTSPLVDLDTNGVESIHLIARSNCAFVNYLTPLHLRHSIAVSNNVSLRPEDPRAKKLVCRVRNHGDDARTGVGAQRLGGMHKAFVREQQVRMAEAQKEIARLEREHQAERGATGQEDEGSPSPMSPLIQGRTEREASLASIRSGSTTSSFLAKHFERRYFILKSHNEQDLLRAVETGSWATQAHNEPVLHQAFRTARSVYLIFGVNGSGCWFGYARMVGPIAGQSTSTGSSRLSYSSRAEKSSNSTDIRMSSASQTILEEPEQPVSPLTALASRPPLFSPSEHRFTAQSPQQFSPSPSTSYAGRLASGLSGPTPNGDRTPTITTSPAAGGSAPATLARAPTRVVPLSAQLAMSREQDLVARETADKLHLPPAAEEAARRAASLESGIHARATALLSSTGARADGDGSMDGRGGESPRKELIAKAAEARNARLEALAGVKEAKSPSGTVAETRPDVTRTGSWGHPFALEWIKVETLPFARTRHIRNSFNGNREIKISRDGTEVEPSAGEQLLNEWWRDRDKGVEDIPLRPSSPQPVLEPTTSEGEGESPPADLEAVKQVKVEDQESSGLPASASESPILQEGRAHTA